MLALSFESSCKEAQRRLAIQRQVRSMGRAAPSEHLHNLRSLRRLIYASRLCALPAWQRRMQD